MRTEAVVLSSNENYVVMLNVVPKVLGGRGVDFVNILDIRNRKEYAIYTSKVIMVGIRENWMYTDCLLLGPTDNRPFVRQWTHNMLRKQEFKGIDIAEDIIFLIGGYYAEPMIQFLQYDHRIGECRYWMMSEKETLKPTDIGFEISYRTLGGIKSKVNWSNECIV